MTEERKSWGLLMSESRDDISDIRKSLSDAISRVESLGHMILESNTKQLDAGDRNVMLIQSSEALDAIAADLGYVNASVQMISDALSFFDDMHNELVPNTIPVVEPSETYEPDSSGWESFSQYLEETYGTIATPYDMDMARDSYQQALERHFDDEPSL